MTPSAEVWDEVSAEADLCTRLKCPHFDACFLFKARRKAADADVVVVNHHLLASDLAVRQASDNWEEAAVLPPYHRLMLDEAHHLEDVAATHLGVQVTSRGVRRLLGPLRTERQGAGSRPSPTSCRDRRPSEPGQSRPAAQRLLPGVADARRASDQLILRLHGRLEGAGRGAQLTDEFGKDSIWAEGLGRDLDATLVAFRSLKDHVETIADRMAGDEVSERRLQLLGELPRGDAPAGGRRRRAQSDPPPRRGWRSRRCGGSSAPGPRASRSPWPACRSTWRRFSAS